MTPIDATRPTSHISIPQAWRTKILNRWRELEPKVTWHERDPLQRDALRGRHFYLVTTLLRAGVEMRVIRRNSLDDVTQPAEALKAKSDKYLEKKSRRRSHVTHVKRTSSQPPPARR